MAVPRNRMSNAKKNSRRAHHAKKPKNVGSCSSCGAPSLSHRICSACGAYGGRNILRATPGESSS